MNKETQKEGGVHSQFIYLKGWQFPELQMCLCLNICIKGILQCPNRQGSWMTVIIFILHDKIKKSYGLKIFFRKKYIFLSV